MDKSLENLSGLRPLGQAVLVKHHKVKALKSSMIEIPLSVQQGLEMLEQHATVVAVGPTCWQDEYRRVPLLWGLFSWKVRAPRAKPGDKVVVTKFAGYLSVGPADGEMYRVVNARDIFCAVTYEAEEVQLRSVANG